MTVSPGPTSAGTGSPVSSAVSTADCPSWTVPSVAMVCPGRTTNRSPTRSAAAATVRSRPSAPSTDASLAPSSASARSAAPARRLARASAYRPARMNTVTAAATSRYVSPPATSAYADHRYAAATPRLTRVSMVAVPCRAFAAAARWNGQAPQTATGVASAKASHCQCGKCSAGTMDSASTGTASAALTSNRPRGPAATSPALSTVDGSKATVARSVA